MDHNFLQLVRVGEHTLPLPAPASDGDFGYDVACAETVVLQPHVPTLVGIGWALATPLPERMAMLVVPRSSTRRKFNLTVPNSPGLVDRYYGAELKVQVELIADTPMTLEAGARFAQLLFVPVLMPRMTEVRKQDGSMIRGGFGSTG